MKGGSMLPHDELWHYGVKGMKWGVRKDRFIKKTKVVTTNVKSHFKDKDNQKKLTMGILATTVLTASAILYGKHLYNASRITNSKAYIRRHGVKLIPTEAQQAKATFEKHVSQLDSSREFLIERYTEIYGPNRNRWPKSNFV
jgi:hypothetical protein